MALKVVKYWCEQCFALMLEVHYTTTRVEYENDLRPRWEESFRECYTHSCPGWIDPDTGEFLSGRIQVNMMIVNGRSVPYHEEWDNSIDEYRRVPHVITHHDFNRQRFVRRPDLD